MIYLRKILIPFIFALSVFNAQAHQSSHSQIQVNVKQNILSGYWDIALHDLQLIMNLDKDANGDISWQELSQQQHIITAYIRHYLKFLQNDMLCPITFGKLMVDKISAGTYAYFPFTAHCQKKIISLNIYYDFLFNTDAQHKALITVASENNSHNIIMSSAQRNITIKLQRINYWKTFKDYTAEGIQHIWAGLDHILFIIALLLPAALYIRKGRWHSTKNFRKTLFDVAKIVTAFTLAHSITLSLSVFGLIRVPSQIIESIIAASVIVAALNNIFPTFHRKLWALSFVFGLIHGLGFASVLADLGLPIQAQGLALLAFNLGVELGQVVIVALALPILFILSQKDFYRTLGLQIGSWLIAALAMIWFIERAGNLELIVWI